MIVEDYVDKYVDPELEKDFMDILNRYSGKAEGGYGRDYDSDIDIDELDWCYNETVKLANRYSESRKIRSKKMRESFYDGPGSNNDYYNNEAEWKAVHKRVLNSKPKYPEESVSRVIEELQNIYDTERRELNAIFRERLEDIIDHFKYSKTGSGTKWALDLADDLANDLTDTCFSDIGEEIWDATAELRQDNLRESTKKTNKKCVSENATTDKLYLNVINAAKKALKCAKIQGHYAVEKKIQDWFDDDNEIIDKESIEKLYDIAVYFDIPYLVKATWEAAEYLDESKKRKMIGKVSMKEARRMKEFEDIDRTFEFEKKLSNAGMIFSSEGNRVAIDYDNNPSSFIKARKFADEVKDEFGGDYQIGMTSSGMATFEFTGHPIEYADYEDKPKTSKRSGELTDRQKSIIEDMAEADYETGHPMSEEDALDWFSSGEEDIPADLAQEAADYYFEAFGQIREDDNDPDDEE